MASYHLRSRTKISTLASISAATAEASRKSNTGKGQKRRLGLEKQDSGPECRNFELEMEKDSEKVIEFRNENVANFSCQNEMNEAKQETQQEEESYGIGERGEEIVRMEPKNCSVGGGSDDGGDEMAFIHLPQSPDMSQTVVEHSNSNSISVKMPFTNTNTNGENLCIRTPSPSPSPSPSPRGGRNGMSNPESVWRYSVSEEEAEDEVVYADSTPIRYSPSVTCTQNHTHTHTHTHTITVTRSHGYASKYLYYK